MRVNRTRTQRGVGLIEVLLAVILLSIGFLASARMQVQSMIHNQNAYALSQAKYLVLDMSERMRANRDGLRAGLYEDLETAANTVEPGCVAAGTTCSAAERVAADRHAWSSALHPTATGAIPLLPSTPSIPAIGQVARDAATGAYQVSVRWSERDGGGALEREVAVQVIPATLP